MEFDAFISHSHDDKAWAIALKAALTKRGLTVWIDHDQIRGGDKVVEALETAIERSRSVLLVVSPESLASAWVQEEWHVALRQSHELKTFRLIPCLLRSRGKVRGFVGNLKAVDFRDPDRFEEAVNELFQAITGRKLDSPSPPLSVANDPADASAEISYLDGYIQNANATRKRAGLTCAAAPFLGFVGSAVLPPVEGFSWIMHYLGPAFVTGLIGVAVTSGKWRRLGDEMRESTLLRMAVTLCAAHRRPECSDVDRRLSDFVKRGLHIGTRHYARTGHDT